MKDSREAKIPSEAGGSDSTTMDQSDQSSRLVSISSLINESAIYGLAKILDPMIGFALLSVITAILTPADYGLIRLFTHTSAIIFTLGSLGIHQSFLRFFTEASEVSDQRRIAGSAITLSLVYWLALLPIGLLAARPIAELWFGSSQPAWVYLLLALSLVETLDALACNLLQASGRAWSFLVATVLNTLLVRSIAIGLILTGSGAWGWVTGETIGRGVACVVILLIAMRGVRLGTSHGEAKELSWYGVMLVPAMLSFYIMSITDTFLMRYLITDWETSLGFYGVGERIATIMHMGNTAIILGWQRFAFRNMHDERGGPMISYGLFLYCAAAGFVVLGLTLLGDDLMHWMINPSFAPGLAVILPLTFAAFAGGLANMCDVGLHRQRMPHVISIVTTIAAALNVALNFYTIPRYGIVGAAGATLAAQVFRLIAIFLVSQRAFRIPIQSRTLGITALYCAVFAAGKTVDRLGWVTSGIIQTIFVATTPVLLWLLPIWTNEERHAVKNLLGKFRLP